MADPLTSPRPHNAVSEGNSSYFAPKNPVEIAEPKDDMISYEELAKHDGEVVASVVSSAMLIALAGSDEDQPIWVSIKGTVFDVSKNSAYKKGGNYHGTSRIHGDDAVVY